MAHSRRFQYADRVALQQADQAIRKDVLRALQVGQQNTCGFYADNNFSLKGSIAVEQYDIQNIRIRKRVVHIKINH